MREVRTFENVEIRAADDGSPQVTLQVIKPGVVDDYGSLWKANAFDESLDQRLPVLCWSHDWSDPLGPGVSWEPGRGGPKVTFKFSDFDAVPQARRAHAQVLDGTIVDCSVGFSHTERRDPTDKERAQYPGIYEVIEKGQLDETSLVLRGAVPGAKVLSVRSVRTARGAVDLEAVMQIAREKAAGNLSDAEAQAAVELLSAGGDASGESAPPAEDPELVAVEEANAVAEAAAVEALSAL